MAEEKEKISYPDSFPDGDLETVLKEWELCGVIYKRIGSTVVATCASEARYRFDVDVVYQKVGDEWVKLNHREFSELITDMQETLMSRYYGERAGSTGATGPTGPSDSWTGLPPGGFVPTTTSKIERFKIKRKKK